ncbi:MAG: hypothetical protein AAF824_02945 [Bacteroidota bacterium]
MLLTHPLRDGGAVYSETDFSRFIVEPYHALSAFVFLILVWCGPVRFGGGILSIRFFHMSRLY